MHEWPFADPPDLAVITLTRILTGESSICLVTHDDDDESWQFLDGEHAFEHAAAVVGLGEMLEFDPTLAVLADLPLGWYAWRASTDADWQRAEGEPPADLISS